MLKELNNENFAKEIQTGLKLVEFYTTWCTYCKKTEPELNAMEKVWIGRVDADKYPDLTFEYKVSAFPTFLIFKEGKEVNRFSGYHKKEDLMNEIIKYL